MTFWFGFAFTCWISLFRHANPQRKLTLMPLPALLNPFLSRKYKILMSRFLKAVTWNWFKIKQDSLRKIFNWRKEKPVAADFLEPANIGAGRLFVPLLLSFFLSKSWQWRKKVCRRWLFGSGKRAQPMKVKSAAFDLLAPGKESNRGKQSLPMTTFTGAKKGGIGRLHVPLLPTFRHRQKSATEKRKSDAST